MVEENRACELTAGNYINHFICTQLYKVNLCKFVNKVFMGKPIVSTNRISYKIIIQDEKSTK